MTNPILWKKINEFNLEDENATFNFTHRLARDNNWKLSFAREVVLEYKKFMYLCAISKAQITPSDAVDQAWHLHLTYTHSYWKNFCLKTIGKEIHHNPTKGGNKEKDKFSNCYDLTFKTYETEFRKPPPKKIWLDNKKRFQEVNYKRINLDRYWLIKKPSPNLTTNVLILFLGLISSTLLIQAQNNSSIIIILIVIIFFLIKLFNKGNKNNGGCNTGCSYSDDSGCSGCSGCGGCGD
ncbi:glycine-rich domain-containing protein [Neotamlana nanhaiensis]|uniref:glycine-rich domain-containing protein n=1 Tax=Neotamlana nanhaiensis TaxID=1382798 RepID=UPI000B0C1701|nr:hypothetical protein [Tamlana nanhaiensis]